MNINDVVKYLKEYDGRKISIMEVCGTHTASIREHGIPSLLSGKINLISGPGCPVCVTPAGYIDKLCELALKENTCVVTFGDMLRVPGSKYSLRDVTSLGGNVKMVYSPFEIIALAKDNSDTEFVFAAVGFETTTPVYALLLDKVIRENIKNVKLLTAVKTMPNAIEFLCRDSESNVDGFLAPGNVSVITGANAFVPIAKKYSLPFVVSGFSAEELLCSIYSIIKLRGKGEVLNMYKSAVTDNGNEKAKQLVDKYFVPCPANWRGMGEIDASGLCLCDEYKQYDAGGDNLFEDKVKSTGCHCADIVTGKLAPEKCPLFDKICTPENPQGACMVSSEGACFNHYINR